MIKMAQFRLKKNRAYIHQHIWIYGHFYVAIPVYNEKYTKLKPIKIKRTRSEASKWTSERWQRDVIGHLISEVL